MFLYSVKSLVLPQITLYTSRADYEAKTKTVAPAPDLNADVKYWVDSDVQLHPEKYGRRVEYDHALALKDNGSLLMVDASQEPDPARRAFYQRHEIKQVPNLQPLMLLHPEATSVNLAYDTAVGGNPQYDAWLKRPIVPPPMRELNSAEAFYATPFSNDVLQYGVCNMAQLEATIGTGRGAVDVGTQLAEILAKVNQILVKLNQGGIGVQI